MGGRRPTTRLHDDAAAIRHPEVWRARGKVVVTTEWSARPLDEVSRIYASLEAFFGGSCDGTHPAGSDQEARMPVRLNHTIVYCSDQQASASFLADVLGLPAPTSFGPFSVVQVANDVSLDFLAEGPVHPQHYAFLVDEGTFDQIHGRILERGIPYWADPERRMPQDVNTKDGGRGLYWLDPDGHVLEILTVPYGGWPEQAGS